MVSYPPLRDVPMPSKIRALPKNKAQYPIPAFAATVNGVPDFRVMRPEAFSAGIRDKERRCWVCGQRRPKDEAAFVIGPMCVVNRTSSEPPSHRDCAEYSVKACPFLTRPQMRRRESGLEGMLGFAGNAILRNPGVSVIWETRIWKAYQPQHEGAREGTGILIELGKPTAVSWWTLGRPATRAEVMESIKTGLPALEEACDKDDDPAAARKALAAMYQRALAYLPAD